MKKKELHALASALGFDLRSSGSAWVATHRTKRSKVNPKRNVTFMGTRSRMSRILKEVEYSLELERKYRG